MEKFILKPSIDIYSGIKVNKDTSLGFENENVKQTVSNLNFHSITKLKGENYESVCDTTIQLQDGDVLIFDGEGRGYIKPVPEFVTIAEAIDDLTNIKDLG